MKTSLLFSILSFSILTLVLMTLPKTVSAQCTNSALNEGLISALSKTGTGTIGNTDTTCVLDTQAAYRDFKVPLYSELEDQFYSLSQSLAKNPYPLTNGSQDFIGDGIYLQRGDLTISSAGGYGVQVIFVGGNLTISGNINYAKDGEAGADPYSGLVFIVRGNIYIDRDVTKVNAVLISSGTICTAYTGSACEPVNTPNYTSQLVINGSLISLNKTNLPAGTTSIQLRRNLLNNTSPAEVIRKQAKYLYILRNGLLTKDLVLTQEDRNYSIDADPGGTPVVPPPDLPTCQKSNPFIVRLVPPDNPQVIKDCIVAIGN